MTQIQALENMSKEALIEHHRHTLQQHADENTSLQKAAAWYEKGLEDAITERDSYQEQADNLAHAISKYFGVDIGEHSSANNPWAEALEVISDAAAPTTPAALRYAAKVIELYDDATMRADYILSSTDCADILEALAEYFTVHPRVSGPQLVQVYKINGISGSVDSDLSQPCTCPSGDGSLRWPCPVHPPATDNLTKSSNQQMASKPPETPQQIVASLRDLSERMKTVGASMSYFGGFNGAMDHRGRELAGAGAIAWDWAAGIEQDISVGAASPTTDTD